MIRLHRNRLQRIINTLTGFASFILALELVELLSVGRIECSTFMIQLMMLGCAMFVIFILLTYINHHLVENYRVKSNKG